jgi:ABC-type transporter Mla MlaB component
MLTPDDANRRVSLVLPDRSDVSSALATHEILIRTQLAAIDSVEFDGSGVVKVDLAVLQLLLGWIAVLDSQHIPWSWRSVSETFQQIAALAGLSSAFRLASE